MKMQNVWKEIEPFFLANGTWGVTQEKYQDAADKTVAICSDMGVPLNYYLQAVFYPRFSEQMTKFRVRPKHLYSQWALRKLKDFVTLGADVTPGKMEALFIKDSKEYIAATGLSDEEYFSGGMLIPKCLEDIRQRRISICYCCSNKDFKDMYKQLPLDMKAEYFEDIDVMDIATQIQLNNPIMSAINSK
jgi:hypothetical protein